MLVFLPDPDPDPIKNPGTAVGTETQVFTVWKGKQPPGVADLILRLTSHHSQEEY